jgi:hypothetical protein
MFKLVASVKKSDSQRSAKCDRWYRNSSNVFQYAQFPTYEACRKDHEV